MIFVLSIVGPGMLPKTFTPDADFSSSTLSIELPPGVLLCADAAAARRRPTTILRAPPGSANVVESVGEDEDGEVRSGNLYIQLVPPAQRKLIAEAMRSSRSSRNCASFRMRASISRASPMAADAI